MPAGVVLACLAAACGEEAPPAPPVSEFLEDRILLEATIVRCAENRDQRKYTPECVNAREAANRIEAQEAAARREKLEAQSERKREALRRAQEAAAEARRRAAEAERLRREAELMGRLPAGTGDETADATEQRGAAGGTVPEGEATGPGAPPDAGEQETGEAVPPATDLDAVREELRRRQQEDAEN